MGVGECGGCSYRVTGTQALLMTTITDKYIDNRLNLMKQINVSFRI